MDAEEQQTTLLSNQLVDKPLPLRQRIKDRIRTNEVGLAIKRNLIRFGKRHIALRNFRIIDQLPIETLRLSEQFIKVLYTKPVNIACNRLETSCYIYPDGGVKGCCLIATPWGNVKQGGLKAVYNSAQARIMRLSSINKSFCYCNRNCTDANQRAIDEYANGKPTFIELAIERACNLACPQCRSEHIYESDFEAKQDLIKLINQDNWLNECLCLEITGSGEVFYSKVNLWLLENYLQRDQIQILSNGTLFNQTRWEEIKAKYKYIDVLISVDAATAVTYQKIRGGDFKQLRQNLAMLGELRGKNKIRSLGLNFVVQKDNYLEMTDFVHLAKKLHVDKINFQHLNDWGTFTKREYRRRNLLLKNGCLDRNFYFYLQAPIFKDPIVDLTAFQPYLTASAKRYDE